MLLLHGRILDLTTPRSCRISWLYWVKVVSFRFLALVLFNDIICTPCGLLCTHYVTRAVLLCLLAACNSCTDRGRRLFAIGSSEFTRLSFSLMFALLSRDCSLANFWSLLLLEILLIVLWVDWGKVWAARWKWSLLFIINIIDWYVGWAIADTLRLLGNHDVFFLDGKIRGKRICSRYLSLLKNALSRLDCPFLLLRSVLLLDQVRFDLDFDHVRWRWVGDHLAVFIVVKDRDLFEWW